MNKSFIGLLVVIVVIGLGWFGMSMSYNNQDVSLRNLAEAQQGVIETKYDNTWKVIQQKAQITSEYKDSFKEIFVGIIEGRYSKDDNTVMKWIQESNPNFDASLYKDLMATVDIKRTEFMNAQNQMIDIVREHKNLVTKVPSKWFVSNTQPIEYTIISSTKTKMTMDTGIEDDVDLFKK